MRRRWTFDEGREGFRYQDDVFRFTEAPDYAGGKAAKGALTLRLGGRDDASVKGMSGGWTKGFELDEAMSVTLSFKVRIEVGPGHGRRDFADVRVALDGEALEVGGKAHVLRLKGAEGAERQKTGWQTIEVELGPLAAGRHEITLGGFSKRKAAKDAFAKYAFDDVRLEGAPPAPVDLDRFERQVLKLTNAFREQNGRDALTAEANLSAAAEDWSRQMAKGDFFRHSDKPGQITEHGYDPRGWGENIAAGYATPKEVVEGWKASPGHRANLLREDFEHIGIGYYFQKNDGGAAPYGHYWTQIFGVPADDYLF